MRGPFGEARSKIVMNILLVSEPAAPEPPGANTVRL